MKIKRTSVLGICACLVSLTVVVFATHLWLEAASPEMPAGGARLSAPEGYVRPTPTVKLLPDETEFPVMLGAAGLFLFENDRREGAGTLWGTYHTAPHKTYGWLVEVAARPHSQFWEGSRIQRLWVFCLPPRHGFTERPDFHRPTLALLCWQWDFAANATPEPQSQPPPPSGVPEEIASRLMAFLSAPQQ